MRSILAIVLTFCWAMYSTASAEPGTFSGGITTGTSNWTFEAGGADEREQNLVFGIAGRYTIPVGDRTFFGPHIALNKETTALEGAYAFGGDGISGKAEINWSADILTRFGIDLGEISPYVAGGISIANATAKASSTYNNMVVFDDSATHVGWKLAIGADFDLTDQLAMFVQAEYADYGMEKYEYNDVSFEAAGKQKAIRVGLMYKF